MITNFGRQFFLGSWVWRYYFSLDLNLLAWFVAKMLANVEDQLGSSYQFLHINQLEVCKFSLGTLWNCQGIPLP